MTIEALLREGRIRVFQAGEEEIQRSLELARRDLALALELAGQHLDWSFSIAYNAVLQCCRAYLFRQGYRPTAEGGHAVVFEFLAAQEDPDLREAAPFFDRARKKRHRTLYDEVGLVTRTQLDEFLRRTQILMGQITERIQQQPTS